MPDSRRYKIKRHLEQISLEMERAKEKAVIVGEMFDGTHDKLADHMGMILLACDTLQQLVNDFNERI